MPATDPLGDQLSWEQLLSQCEKSNGRLWIITGDLDFATKHSGELFLNAALYEDLVKQMHTAEPEVFCFDDLSKGLEHFATTNGVKAKELPTPEEAEQIKKEQESLFPIDWLNDYDDSATYLVVRTIADRQAAQMRVAAMSQVASEPPQINETDKGGGP